MVRLVALAALCLASCATAQEYASRRRIAIPSLPRPADADVLLSYGTPCEIIVPPGGTSLAVIEYRYCAYYTSGGVFTPSTCDVPLTRACPCTVSVFVNQNQEVRTALDGNAALFERELTPAEVPVVCPLTNGRALLPLPAERRFFNSSTAYTDGAGAHYNATPGVTWTGNPDMSVMQ